MARKSLLWLGILLILCGVAQRLYYALIFDYSDRELTPINVTATRSGSETRAWFTATRQTSYEVSIVMAIPLGTSSDDAMHKYACMMRPPGCHWENDQCREQGRLKVSGAALNGRPQEQEDTSADCHYGIRGVGSQQFAVRDLFIFDAVPGKDYVVSARVAAEDATLANRELRLLVEAMPAWRSEEEDFASLVSDTWMLVGVLLGTTLIVVSRRSKRTSENRGPHTE